MASKIVKDKEIKATFVTVGGKEYTFTVNRPDDELSESDLYDAVLVIKNSDVIKPDGTSLNVIKSLKVVNKEETILDLDALASV